MVRPSFLVCLLLAACASARAQPPAPKLKIEAADHQLVMATITYEIKTTNFAVTRWLVYLPEPPELPSQTNLKTTSTPAAKVIAEGSPLARKVRLIDVPVGNPVPGAKLSLKLEVEATLRTRRLVALGEGEKAPKVAALTAAEQKYYTAATPRIDHDAKPFREWLDAKDLKLKKDEPPHEFAGRVLAVIRADYTYGSDKGDRLASVVCGQGSTDCAGMSYVFCAAMRANKIPARTLFGRKAAPRQEGTMPGDNGYNQPHVRAEFYMTSVGWVPVDPTYAQGDKSKPVSHFVGHDPGDLLVLHVDPDLLLAYPDKNKYAHALQLSPSYLLRGKGQYDGALGPTGWELKATPVKK